MLLIIDNSVEHEITFTLLVDKKVVHAQFAIKENNDFLLSLENFLIKENVELNKITALGLVMGTGRFTATRLLVALINTLAFSLKVPVLALPAGFDIDQVLSQAAQSAAGQYILPVYSSEPHISASKQKTGNS